MKYIVKYKNCLNEKFLYIIHAIETTEILSTLFA